MLLLTVLALLPLAKPPVVSVEQEKTVLRFSFRPDETVRYMSKTTVESEVMGQAMKVSVNFTQHLKVVEAKSDSVSLQLTMHDFEMEGDSAAESQEVVSALEKLVMDMQINQRGEVTKISRAGEETESGMVNQMFGSPMAGMKGLGFMGIVYPEEAIGVGSKWRTVVDAANFMGSIPGASGGSGEFVLECEVADRKVTDGTATLAINTHTTASITMGFQSPTGESAELTLVVFGDVVHTVDVKTGLIVTSIGNVSTTTELGEFKMELKSTLSVERLPNLAPKAIQ